MNDNEMQTFLDGLALETQAIRQGHVRSHEGEHSEPIFATSSYVFESAEAAAKRFSGEDPGNVYSRYTNPTVAVFEKRIAALEGAEAAVATSSGMAAILACCMALLQQGDHVLCSRSVFGTTTSVFSKYLAKFGIKTTFVDGISNNEWQDSCTDKTRMFFVESPSNPLAEIVDIKAVSQIAKAQNALLVVDNCFCTPALQQPLALGADIVVHSATKFLDGQGRCLGGVACGPKALMNEVLAFVRSTGPTMSPFNAWVFIKGLETLALRMRAHSEQSLELAKWLEQQPLVEHVYYAGLTSHPQHALAKRQQSAFGGVLAFTVKGGKEQAWQVIDGTRFLSITANLGDVKTTIVHPATTTHGRLSEQDRKAAGVSDNLIRISVGLEALDDIKADLQKGFEAIHG